MLVQQIALQFLRDEQGWYKFRQVAAKQPSEVSSQAGLERHRDGSSLQQKHSLIVVQLLVATYHAGIEFLGRFQYYPE